MPTGKGKAGRGEYITRMDYDRTHGYAVRVPTDEGKVSKFFSDGKYGGKREALIEAEKHRDKLLPSLVNFDGAVRRYFHKNPSSRSTTDVAGVFPCFKTSTNGGLLKYYIGTYYKTPYESKRRGFSVQRYGEKEALRLACEFRAGGEVAILKDREEKKRPTTTK